MPRQTNDVDIGTNASYVANVDGSRDERSTVRKQPLQIHLDPDMASRLRAEAQRQGVSLGEVVRRALEKALGAREKAV